MSLRQRWSIRSLLALVLLTLFGSSFVHSQEKGLEALQQDVTVKYRILIPDPLRGYDGTKNDVTADPKNPEHIAALKAETKWLTFRFVDPLFLNAARAAFASPIPS